MEARCGAAHRVHPCCQRIVIWSRPVARFAGVGDDNVPTVSGTIIPVLEALEWHRGPVRALSHHRWQLVSWCLISVVAPAAGQLSTAPRFTATA